MQDLLAILIVAVAAGYLARRMWLRVAGRKSGACGSCSNCGPAGAERPKPLVTISLDMSRSVAMRR